jgi:hypothetical protein
MRGSGGTSPSPKKADRNAFRADAAGKFVVLVEEGEVNKNGGAGGSAGRGARFNSIIDHSELIFGISSCNRFGLEKHFTFIFE